MSRIQADLASSRPHSGTSTPTTVDGLETPAMFRHLITKGRKPHVCVVGAGVAGLRCADLLLKQGIKVTVLEARNRVGGRLCQARVGPHLVDMGPNWIHGTINNPILDLVRETETVACAFGERQATWNHDGVLIDPDTTKRYSTMLWDIIGEAFKHSNEHSADIPPDESLMDFIRHRTEGGFADVGEEESFRSSDIKDKQLLYHMAEVWGAFVGGTTDTQSLKFLWLEECLEGETLFCAGTYERVLNAVAKPALDAGVIRFEKNVTKIVSSIDKQSGNPTVKVTTEDGAAELFDEVVFTAPLGWLKRNRHVFEPSLPDRVSQAVDNLGYGNLDKVYFTFPEAFWEITPASKADTTESVANQEAASSDGPIQSTSNGLESTNPPNQPKDQGGASSLNSSTRIPLLRATEGPSDSPSTSFPAFATFVHPTYAPDTNPSRWAQECINLSALPAPHSHATLLFYTTGATSAHIATLLRTHPDPTAAITAFFAPYIARLPGYSADAPACVPSAVLATAWATDELAGCGSYVNFPTGVREADRDVRALREGAPAQGVWLAGEHCAPFVALGTVTGAWWAGAAVGERIAAAWGLGEGSAGGANGNEEVDGQGAAVVKNGVDGEM